MLRGFLTTLGIVSAITLVSWTYADQTRMARATPVADITPAATSVTTNSNLAAKGDQLKADVKFSSAASVDNDGAINRIVEAHLLTKSKNDNTKFLTVAKAGAGNETILTRVPLND
ncbi:hypothetical protein [Terrihabitans sp. B22-R8]|uniref:hypothetical protein n=1 Tax=Terrihabitans sp. B22-R8 TaxID=3425128 RepID=UPI00403C2754